MERLTARNQLGLAYLKNVKPNEQDVESPYPNTLQCILESFNQLAAYEDTGKTPEQVAALEKQNAELRELLKLAVEDIHKLLCEEYGSPCQFCKYDNSEDAMCCKIGGSGSWCCQNAKWQRADRMEAAEAALKGDKQYEQV